MDSDNSSKQQMFIGLIIKTLESRDAFVPTQKALLAMISTPTPGCNAALKQQPRRP